MNILNDQNWTPYLLETKRQVTYFFKKYPIQGEVIKSISILGRPDLCTKKDILGNYYCYGGIFDMLAEDYEEKHRQFEVERARKKELVKRFEDIPRDDSFCRRSIVVDSLVLIQFESGNQLEIDMSKCGVFYMAMNQLPHDTVTKETKRHMIDGNKLFSPILGKKIQSYKVGTGPLNHYYEEYMGHIKNKENCPKTFNLYLNDGILLRFFFILDTYQIVCFQGNESMPLSLKEFEDAVEIE